MIRSPKVWGATVRECRVSYPCDRFLEPPYRSYHRAVSVQAPSWMTFRWLCQLKVGEYTYPLLGSGPRRLTPGSGELAIGQRFLIFDLVDFRADDHITGVTAPELAAKYGAIAVTYRVVPRNATHSRIIVRSNVAGDAGLPRWLPGPLAWADAVLMRKQLLTLKALAERDWQARRAPRAYQAERYD
ncbi:hypothetical protein [Spirillospora sp. CA-294931]|uniref:hypothetical protein n=1 Tax=Spirillospora sp. CA-294931 TaxID=3240042 RepID=UPI003D8FE0CF